MRRFRHKFLFSLACMLFAAMAVHAQYSQGDTIDVIADRYVPTFIEAEWFDADSSRKVDENDNFSSVIPLVLPVVETSGDTTYVKSGPSSMLLYYNINVGAAGGTFKLKYRYKKTAELGNIRHWIDGNYRGGTKATAQTPLPGSVADGWTEFTDGKILTFGPGYHSYGILMNRSNTHLVDYFYLVPITLNEEGAKATITTPTTNPGMVMMNPDYDTSFVVGDEIEFTAVPEEYYYFHNWEGDVSGSENPLSHILDTTNKVKAVFYRIPDTVFIASERYAPVDFEAEATTKIWHRDHPVDSLTEIGILSNNVRSIREGKEVISNIQHGGKMFFPIEVGGEGGKYRLTFSFFRNSSGGDRPGAFIELDGVSINNGEVLQISGPDNAYGTTISSTAFMLTPGNHTIALKPNGGSNRYDLDKITFIVDSIAAEDAQLNVSAGLGGSVGITPDYGTHYVVGDNVSLEATPDFGFLFGSWSGDVTSTDNPLGLMIDSAMNIVANFIDDPDISNFTVTVTPKDSGMVSISPELEDYATGSDITLEAIPKFGYYFSAWSGDTVSTVNPLTIDSIAKDYVIDANFEALPTYQITIVDPQNTVVKSLDLDAYPEGTTVTLTAGQNRTHRFTYWNDDMDNTDKDLVITIMADTTVTANYETKDEVMPGDYFYIDADAYVTDTIQAEWYDRELSDQLWTGPESGQEFVIDTIPGTDTIYVTKTGNGKGIEFVLMVGNEGGEYVLDYIYRRNVLGTNNVKVFIDGKQISSDYAEISIPETPVGQWAIATSNHNVVLTPGKHVLRLQPHYSDRHDVDYFTFTPVPGTIEVEGGLRISVDEEKGSVTKTPDKLVYDKGESVVITADPLEGYLFSGWTGDFTGLDNPLTVTMDSSINLTANFVTAFAVTINAATVNGTISVSPEQDLYPVGDTVTFTPVPDAGYKFDAWFGEGGIGGSDVPLVLVMNRNIDLTAYFSVVTYQLITTADNGTISKSPSRISYNAGTSVELTATADAGYEFTGWSGDVTGTDNPLTITMDSTINITANFSQANYVLTTNAVNGTISVSPDETSYAPGTQVVITATADAGYEFTGWSGDATGTDNPLTVTMNSDIDVTAEFQIESGIEANGILSFSVYPNPSSGRFIVDISVNELEYSVIHLSGRVVKTGKAYGLFELDMSEFNKGVYALSIKTQKGSLVRRIILE